MKHGKGEVEQGLRAYLAGYGRHDPGGLAAIADYSGWARLAAFEHERRMVSILRSLPLSEVRAIAGRDVDLNELAKQALASLSKEQDHGHA